jgi:hypothetical protein
MTISLKIPIKRLKKTDAIIIRDATPTFLYKDLSFRAEGEILVPFLIQDLTG